MRKEEIFTDLRERIIQGKLSPGQWLVERELCDLYQISRTPIRENLRNLASLGVVALEPAKGYRVKDLGVEEIVEIFQAREMLEGECARLACLKYSPDFLDKIEILKNQLEEIDVLSDSAHGVSLGKNIHDLIVKTANNRYLSELYEKLSCMAALTRNMTQQAPKIEEKSKEAHLRLLDALSKRDPALSEKCMREHLHSTCRSLVDSNLNLPSNY